MRFFINQLTDQPVLSAQEGNVFAAAFSDVAKTIYRFNDRRGTALIHYAHHDAWPKKTKLLLELQSHDGEITNPYSQIFGGISNSYELVYRSIANVIADDPHRVTRGTPGTFFSYNRRPVLQLCGECGFFMIAVCISMDAKQHLYSTRAMELASAVILAKLYSGDGYLQRSLALLREWQANQPDAQHYLSVVDEANACFEHLPESHPHFYTNYQTWCRKTYPKGQRPFNP